MGRNDHWTEQDRARDHSYGNAHDYAEGGGYPGSEAYSSDDYRHAGMRFREGSGGGSGAGYAGSAGADIGTQGNRGFWERDNDERAVARAQDPEDHRGKGPRGYRRSDARIEEDVNEMLTADPWLDASEISVKVQDGEVTLSGSVATRQEKRRAEDLAHGARGVAHVQNDIRMVSPTLERTRREAQEGSDDTPETTALEDTVSGQKSSIGAAARMR